MLSGLFFDVLAISDKAKESYTQFRSYLLNSEWKPEYNKEAHKHKSADFEEIWTLDNDQWSAELKLFCGYCEHGKQRVFDWEITQCEEKLYCEEYRYERECYPHL